MQKLFKVHDFDDGKVIEIKKSAEFDTNVKENFYEIHALGKLELEKACGAEAEKIDWKIFPIVSCEENIDSLGNLNITRDLFVASSTKPFFTNNQKKKKKKKNQSAEDICSSEFQKLDIAAESAAFAEKTTEQKSANDFLEEEPSETSGKVWKEMEKLKKYLEEKIQDHSATINYLTASNVKLQGKVDNLNASNVTLTSSFREEIQDLKAAHGVDINNLTASNVKLQGKVANLEHRVSCLGESVVPMQEVDRRCLIYKLRDRICQRLKRQPELDSNNH